MKILEENEKTFLKNPYVFYEKLIKEYDEIVLKPLSVLKINHEKEKNFWRKEIDKALDDRLSLMNKKNFFKRK